MKTICTIGAAAWMFVVFTCAYSVRGQTIETPPQFKVAKSLSNGLSGDRRISLATFHTLLVIDTNDQYHRQSGLRTYDEFKALLNAINNDFIGDGIKAGQILNSNFRALAFTDTEGHDRLMGANVTKAQIFASIERIKNEIRNVPRPPPGSGGGHVVFAWFEAEGKLKGTKRYLQLANGDEIDREDLKKRLEVWDGNQRLTRLTILVTDACSKEVAAGTAGVAGLARPDDYGRGQSAGSAMPRQPSEIHGWRSLYFGHRGTVDVSSSARGEPAYAAGGVSLFARAFRNAFDKLPKGLLDINPQDNFIDWQGEFLNAIQGELQFAPAPNAAPQTIDPSGSNVFRLVEN
jgi:hypothetical protein